jgi:hypothetical protein
VLKRRYDEGFVGLERARHRTIVLTKRENVLYSWKNSRFWCAASRYS